MFVYRRAVKNDNNQKMKKMLEVIQAKEAAIKAKQEAYDKLIADANAKTNNIATTGRLQEAANEHSAATTAYTNNPTEYIYIYRKYELDRTKTKLEKSIEAIEELNKKTKSLFEIFKFIIQ
jgi:hypothetical protein